MLQLQIATFSGYVPIWPHSWQRSLIGCKEQFTSIEWEVRPRPEWPFHKEQGISPTLMAAWSASQTHVSAKKQNINDNTWLSFIICSFVHRELHKQLNKLVVLLPCGADVSQISQSICLPLFLIRLLETQVIPMQTAELVNFPCLLGWSSTEHGT